jgi:hypothetical protein
MDRNDLPLNTRHLGVPSRVPKMISMTIVHSAQTVHLSSVNINTFQTDWNEVSLDPRYLGVPSCVPKIIFMPWYIQIKLHTNIALRLTYLQTDRNEVPLDPRHVGVPSGPSKIIFKPMVHSAQTIHLFCADTNTISKRTEASFHLTYIT